MWENVATLSALGLSAIAVVVSIWSVRHARRSADAATESAQADTKLAALAEAEANRYVPPWRIEPSPTGKNFLLINGSLDETAYDVRITGDVMVTPERSEIGPLESVLLLDVRSFDSANHPVVTWNRPPEKGGEEKTWHGTLP